MLDDRFEQDILKYDDGHNEGIVSNLLRDLPDDISERGYATRRSAREAQASFGVCLPRRAPLRRSFSVNYLKRESERDHTLLDRIMAWFPEDGLHVEYSRQGDGRDFSTD